MGQVVFISLLNSQIFASSLHAAFHFLSFITPFIIYVIFAIFADTITFHYHYFIVFAFRCFRFSFHFRFLHFRRLLSLRHFRHINYWHYFDISFSLRWLDYFLRFHCHILTLHWLHIFIRYILFHIFFSLLYFLYYITLLIANHIILSLDTRYRILRRQDIIIDIDFASSSLALLNRPDWGRYRF